MIVAAHFFDPYLACASCREANFFIAPIDELDPAAIEVRPAAGKMAEPHRAPRQIARGWQRRRPKGRACRAGNSGGPGIKLGSAAKLGCAEESAATAATSKASSIRLRRLIRFSLASGCLSRRHA